MEVESEEAFGAWLLRERQEIARDPGRMRGTRPMGTGSGRLQAV